METKSAEETSPSAPELSIIQKIIGVFTSPGKTFASIEVKPSVWVPILLIVALSTVYIIFAGDVIISYSMQMQEKAMQERGMDAAAIEQQLEMVSQFTKYGTPIFAVIVPPLILLIIAAVFMFVGNVILGGKVGFKTVFAVTAWSWLIMSAYGMMTLPLVLAKQSILVTFSLATFLADESATSFLYQLLAKVDVFMIYWIAVYSVGLAVVYKMKTKKMATAVVAVYVIYAFVAATFSGMFS